MDMKLISIIRKCGWPDRYGQRQYGNAAVLCFLESHEARLADIDPKRVANGAKAVQRFFRKLRKHTKEGDCYQQSSPFPLP